MEIKNIKNAVEKAHYNYSISVAEAFLEKNQDKDLNKLIKNNMASSTFIRSLTSVCKDVYSQKNLENSFNQKIPQEEHNLKIKEIVDNITDRFNNIIYEPYTDRVLKEIAKKSDYPFVDFSIQVNGTYNLVIKREDKQYFETQYTKEDKIEDVSKMADKIVKQTEAYWTGWGFKKGLRDSPSN